jgi:flavin-dependent dehydrogenase
MLGDRPGRGTSLVVAQEIEFRLPQGERGEYGIERDIVQFYFCADLKGYGWCFAKGDYLNVGLGREDSHRLSEHVERFCVWLRQRGIIPRDLPGKFNGHAYLLYPGSQRKLYDEGVLLVGDAAGLAYPRSGEGIRPAVESALMAAELIVDVAGDYRPARLAPYLDCLTQRFGSKSAQQDIGEWLPTSLKQSLAARLLATTWFARHVVIDRWFLHAGQSALVAR